MEHQIQKNALHYYIDLLRGKEWNETDGALRNVIRTMRESRHDKICGENFDCIDFGNIPINNIAFSDNGEKSSSFRSCRLSSANFITGHKGEHIIYATFSDDSNFVITWGLDAKTILWDINSKTPIKSECDKFYSIFASKFTVPESIINFLKANQTDIYLFDSTNEQVDYITECVLKFYNRSNEAIDSETIFNEDITFQQVSEDLRYAIFKSSVRISESAEKFSEWILFDLYSKEIVTRESPNNIFLSKSGKHYVICNCSRSGLYDMTAHKILTFESELQEISEIYLSSCGRFLLSRSRRYVHRWESKHSVGFGYFYCDILWNLNSFKIISKRSEFVKEGKQDEYEDLQNTLTRFGITDFTFISKNDTILSPDGKMIARISFLLHKFEFENLEKHENSSIVIYDNGEIECATFTSENTDFIYLSHNYITCDYSLVSWNSSILNSQVTILEILKHAHIRDSCFSVDAKYLYVGRSDGLIMIFETKTGKHLKTLYHISSVNVQGCNFTDTVIDEQTAELLRQNGGVKYN